MAYMSGLMAVKYCNTVGMLLTGVVSPDSSENGMMNSSADSMACCMVAITEDSSKPMPTAANRNMSSPTYKVTIEPANGIWNHNCATRNTPVACAMPTTMDGSALPAMISNGSNGVTRS